METKEKKLVKVRFAPSPSGFFHIGSARTALFNYLFARKNNGVFVLRIEDTNQKTSKQEYEKNIIQSLEWLGINWDGEIFRQSERFSVYKQYLEQLIKEKKAYYCFCSAEELESYRQYQMSKGEAPKYSGKCVSLSEQETEKLLKENKNCAVRLRVEIKKIKFHDVIRGKIEFDTKEIGDFIIAKKDNENYIPLYNFSVTIDDAIMEISHVIRGEDLISSTPRQILLQEAFSFPEVEYAHLPLILDENRAKMSKRQEGAALVNEFKELGYLPEAMFNFISFLGWNPGDNREILTKEELIKEFSLERIQKGGAIFNTNKLNFLNGFYIRQKPIEELTRLCLPYLIKDNLIEPIQQNKEDEFRMKTNGEIINIDWIQKVISANQERLKFLSEIGELSDFFFKTDLNYEKELLFWKNNGIAQTAESLEKSFNILEKINQAEWKKENIEKELLLETERMGDKGLLLWPLRIALSGKKASPPPFEIASILGRQETLRRVKIATNYLQKN